MLNGNYLYHTIEFFSQVLFDNFRWLFRNLLCWFKQLQYYYKSQSILTKKTDETGFHHNFDILYNNLVLRHTFQITITYEPFPAIRDINLFQGLFILFQNITIWIIFSIL